MKTRPTYFEAVRQEAAQRWDLLERDRVLAGPWHQLFKQVQSPRHVLSELLQNADDAGATEASVRIEDQVFVFEHNGEDFIEEHFVSLCRFGYSNKRALHTIGFRGIGFKSTFSLGDRVELFTPSLSASFQRQRFTEPEWLGLSPDTEGRTRIRVEISDKHREREVEKNLEEWLKSPVSLLFFKNIRRMWVGNREVHWGSLGPGPIPQSEWMALYEKDDEAFLLIQSEPEAFPGDALAEIRQERMLGTEEETEFPPCKVEIVLGAKGRLYVVLPTGVETKLPFACNAPFIQDPARLKIKDPETSPTNRWLLERAGKLAASAMLRWLGQEEASLIERSRAYGFFPDVDREDNSLEGVCGTIVEEAFAEAIDGKHLLLTEVGQLVPEKRSVIIPRTVLGVWPAVQAAALLDTEGRPALCHNVEADDRKKLLRWGIVEEIDKQKLLGILQENHLPKPETWRQLLILWEYVAPEITGYHHDISAEDIKIVPVQGKDVLYAASEVVRLGEKKLLQSEDDWEFLAKYLIVLNQNWPRFLAEQRRAAAEHTSALAKGDVEAAYAILEEISLDDTSDVNKVVEQVAMEFFTQNGITLDKAIQLAQIAAKLGANVGSAFRFATRDRRLRSTDKEILFDLHGKLEALLPEAKRNEQLLHADYSARYSSCSREDWLQWIASGKSGLRTFVPLVELRTFVGRRKSVDELLKKRGFSGTLASRYSDPWFYLYDLDFDSSIWTHWQKTATMDPSLWPNVVDHLMSERQDYWSQKTSARIVEEARNGRESTVVRTGLTPNWALRLKDLPCLPDTRGFHRKPGDLLRRTPETESLIDVELFVHGLLDRETTRPLLDLLGVRSTPTGPDRLLDRVRALAKAEKPPVHEVEKWYSRLDQMVDTCSTTDFQKIRQALRTEKLILTQDGSWATGSAVFLSSDDEDVPDAAVIRPSVSDLALWRKMGVAERPTAELAIEWLKSLPSGTTLSQEDARRARALLIRHPVRAWEECQHWINLAGEWAPVDSLAYALTMQSLVQYRHLHQWVKQKTADFQKLPGETTSNTPFSELPPLAAQIEERLQNSPLFAGQPLKKDWLRTLGSEFSRVELDSEDETNRVRALAGRLARTKWLETPGLEIIPYIDGTPAGTPRRVDLVWLDEGLYVEPLPKAKLARRVPEEIGKAFNRSDIKAALDYSFERSAQDVYEYLEENFSLSAAVSPLTEPTGAPDFKDTAAPSSVKPPENVGGSCNEPSPVDDADVAQEAQPGTIDATEQPARASEDEQTVIDGIDHPDPRPRPAPKPAKPSIMERFAKAQGFQKESEERFFHQNGSWIGRVHDSSFPWERRTASGDLVRYYWPKDHCLELQPLQLEADIWGLIDRFPDSHAFILSTPQGDAVEMPGARLRAMCDGGELTLYPAAYRLVVDHDRKQ